MGVGDLERGSGRQWLPTRVPPPKAYGVHTSSDQLQNTESSPPSPPSLGGTRFQSPPELALAKLYPKGLDPAEVPSARERARWDLGGKNLRDETQETYVYTVAQRQGRTCPVET